MNKIKSIKQEILNNIDGLKVKAEVASSLQEICKLYGLPANGKQTAWIKERLLEINFDISVFRQRQIERQTLHPVVLKTCPICQNSFETKSGARGETTYCSYSCSHKSRKHSEETKSKIAKALTKNPAFYKKTCEFCHKEFECKKEKTRFCSGTCCRKFIWTVPGYKEKIVRSIQKRIDDGTHIGWKSRASKSPSYAERFFIKVLQNNKIEFVREFPCCGYFIDFAIANKAGKKIALEIDGKQHLFSERAASDKLKDEALSKDGWVIHRIPWKSLNNETNRIYMKEKILEFVNLYYNL